MANDNWQDEYVAMVQDCEQRFGALSEWEQSFIHSLRVQMDKPRFVISPRQVEKLEAIWERVTDGVPTVNRSLDIFDEEGCNVK